MSSLTGGRRTRGRGAFRPARAACGGGWPHDGDVADGADSVFVIFRFAARRCSSGDRSARRCGRAGATGSTAPTAGIDSRVDFTPPPWLCRCGDERAGAGYDRAAPKCAAPTRPVFFIPWRGSPKTLARRIATYAGRLGGAAAGTIAAAPTTRSQRQHRRPESEFRGKSADRGASTGFI
jgi:hypothetical protein